MKKLWITPPFSAPLYILPIGLWVLDWLYLTDPYFAAVSQQSGYQDGEAMALGIAWIGAIFALPLLSILLFLILRNYPGCVSLWAWNRHNHLISIVWTAFFLWIINDLIQNVYYLMSLNLPLKASVHVGYGYLCLAFRSILIERSKPTRRTAALEKAIFPANDPEYCICSNCGFEQWRKYSKCQKCNAPSANLK